MTCAAVYARKSTHQAGVADERKSVSRQIEQARQCAIRKGWTVDEALVFVDDATVSAEFAALQAWAASGEDVERKRLNAALNADILTVDDMTEIFNIGKHRFHELAKAGRFDAFELHPRIGATKWSRALVRRYADGESLSGRSLRARDGKR